MTSSRPAKNAGAGSGSFRTRPAFPPPSPDQSDAFGCTDLIVPNVKKYAPQTITKATPAAAKNRLAGKRSRASETQIAPTRKKSGNENFESSPNAIATASANVRGHDGLARNRSYANITTTNAAATAMSVVARPPCARKGGRSPRTAVAINAVVSSN